MTTREEAALARGEVPWLDGSAGAWCDRCRRRCGWVDIELAFRRLGPQTICLSCYEADQERIDAEEMEMLG